MSRAHQATLRQRRSDLLCFELRRRGRTEQEWRARLAAPRMPRTTTAAPTTRSRTTNRLYHVSTAIEPDSECGHPHRDGWHTSRVHDDRRPDRPALATTISTPPMPRTQPSPHRSRSACWSKAICAVPVRYLLCLTLSCWVDWSAGRPGAAYPLSPTMTRSRVCPEITKHVTMISLLGPANLVFVRSWPGAP